VEGFGGGTLGSMGAPEYRRDYAGIRFRIGSGEGFIFTPGFTWVNEAVPGALATGNETYLFTLGFDWLNDPKAENNVLRRPETSYER
jgi:hypothetical protein